MICCRLCVLLSPLGSFYVLVSVGIFFAVVSIGILLCCCLCWYPFMLLSLLGPFIVVVSVGIFLCCCLCWDPLKMWVVICSWLYRVVDGNVVYRSTRSMLELKTAEKARLESCKVPQHSEQSISRLGRKKKEKGFML